MNMLIMKMMMMAMYLIADGLVEYNSRPRQREEEEGSADIHVPAFVFSPLEPKRFRLMMAQIVR
jgi:hypothetical protein